MRRLACLIVVLAILPLLSGCQPDQSKVMAVCEAEAARFFPIYRTADPASISSQYIIECMADKGYEFTVAPADCDSRHALPTQAACYEPQNWFAALIDRARRYFKAI